MNTLTIVMLLFVSGMGAIPTPEFGLDNKPGISTCETEYKKCLQLIIGTNIGKCKQDDTICSFTCTASGGNIGGTFTKTCNDVPNGTDSVNISVMLVPALVAYCLMV